MLFMTNRLGAGLALCLSLPALASVEPARADGKKSPPARREIACTYSHKNPMSSGEARLKLVGEAVSRLYFNTYFAGGRDGVSYVCDIDWSRADAAYEWRDSRAGTLITIKETGDTVELVRDKKKKGYVLNFANLNRLSKWCGSGADVPEDVFVPLAGKQCKVTLSR